MSDVNRSRLSQYGVHRMKEGVAVMKYGEMMKDAFSAEHCEGVINMAVAENTLMTGYLAKYFEKHFSLRPIDFTYGDSLASSVRLREALASFLNRHFHPWRSVSSDHLIAGAGLLPVISQLGRALIDPGHGILLAAPYYHGFDTALTSQHDIKIVGVAVPFKDMFSCRELEHFEVALSESLAGGVKIQAVFLCNPQNPYGRCYTEEVLVEYCRFCEKHDLHLVSDEVYALSTFPSGDIPIPAPFQSIISLDLDSLCVQESRVHMLYGMSKDFDANGFRAGVLFTRNERLLCSLHATSIFMIVASPTAALWSTLLEDEHALETYIQGNRNALQDAYEHLTGWLKFHEIPYIPSAAGHFLMVDFRHILHNVTTYGPIFGIHDDQSMVSREQTLRTYLVTKKVVLGPGTGLHMEEGGWFRFTFSMPHLVLDTAFARIEEALRWNHWPGMAPSMSLN